MRIRLLYKFCFKFFSSKREIPKIIFVLGPPGSGKGTQSIKLSNQFNAKHLSAGDLLRKELSKENSSFKNTIHSFINSGKIVPVEITCNLLKQEIFVSKENLFIIDGFPRNQNNLHGFLKILGTEVSVEGVIFIKLEENKIIERLLSRKRSDDNLQVIKNRIDSFNNETITILPELKKLGYYVEVEGDKCVNSLFFELKNQLKYIV